MIYENEEVERETKVIEEEEVVPDVYISLSFVLGLTNPKTMKMMGTIGGVEVMTMVDLAATNNFISIHMVSRLKIPYTNHNKFVVPWEMGIKSKVRGNAGICALEYKDLLYVMTF